MRVVWGSGGCRCSMSTIYFNLGALNKIFHYFGCYVSALLSPAF